MTSPDPAQPQIVERPEVPYAGLRGTVTMSTIASIADRFPDVFGHLAARGATIAGAPFLRYRRIDMERELVVECGVPVAAPVDGADAGVTDVITDVFTDVVPAGRYATLLHVGHPDQLVARNGELLAWADAQGLRFDVSDTPDGEVWGARLEVLLTDPTVQPDMDKWETQLAFRLAD